MITVATNNAAVSPTIYSSGLFSQTAHTAQPNRKLQPFYAKQTQFPKPEMDLTPYCKTAYGEFRVCSPRQNKPNFNPPIEDRSLSRLVGAALLFRAFSFSCFNPTIMQNKPNFQKHKMDLSHYEQKDYEHEPPFAFGQNKPNLAAPRKSAHGGSTPHLQRTFSGPPAPPHKNQSKPNVFLQNSSKVPKNRVFSQIFLTFSHIFANFHRQSARLCRIAPQSARTCPFVSIFFWRTPRNNPKTNPQNPP